MGNEPWDDYAKYLNGATIDPEEEKDGVGESSVEVTDEPEPASSSPVPDVSSPGKRVGSSRKKSVSRQKGKSDVNERMVGFRLSNDEYFYLMSLAFLTGTSVSALLRSLIADYIDKNKGLLKDRILEK